VTTYGLADHDLLGSSRGMPGDAGCPAAREPHAVGKSWGPVCGYVIAGLPMMICLLQQRAFIRGLTFRSDQNVILNTVYCINPNPT